VCERERKRERERVCVHVYMCVCVFIRVTLLIHICDMTHSYVLLYMSCYSKSSYRFTIYIYACIFIYIHYICI